MITPSDNEEVTEKNNEQEPGPEQDLWNIRRWMILATAMLNLLGVAGIAITAVVIFQTRNYTDCQRGYNADVVRVIKDRSKASDLDRLALQQIAQSGKDMVKAILDPNATNEQRIISIRAWSNTQVDAEKKLSEANEQRKNNPLPEPRNC